MPEGTCQLVAVCGHGMWLRYVVAVALACGVAAVADARSSGLARKSFRAPVLALLMASVSLLALGLFVYV